MKIILGFYRNSFSQLVGEGNHCMKGNLQQEVHLLNPQSYNNKRLPYMQ